MKDYKVIQYVNLKTKQYDDMLNNIDFIVQNQTEAKLVETIYDYFAKKSSGPLIFPAKSYAVAIIYAFLIEKYFKTPFLESLNDEDLFFSSDKFFIPYQQNKKVYDQVLIRLTEDHLLDFENSEIEAVQKTISYFCQEFEIIK